MLDYIHFVFIKPHRGKFRFAILWVAFPVIYSCFRVVCSSFAFFVSTILNSSLSFHFMSALSSDGGAGVGT